MKSKKTGVTKEAATHCRAAVEAMQSEAQPASQAAEVFHRGVGEGGVVQVVPKGLDRIQLRGIRGEPLNLQPSAILLHHFGHASAAVGGEAIPQQNHRTATMAPQGFEKTNELPAADAATMQSQQPAQARAGGVSTAPIPDSRRQLNGSTTTGVRPLGAQVADRRTLGEGRLVGKHQPSVQP